MPFSFFIAKMTLTADTELFFYTIFEHAPVVSRVILSYVRIFTFSPLQYGCAWYVSLSSIPEKHGYRF
jgi:hypothetical protein